MHHDVMHHARHFLMMVFLVVRSVLLFLYSHIQLVVLILSICNSVSFRSSIIILALDCLLGYFFFFIFFDFWQFIFILLLDALLIDKMIQDIIILVIKYLYYLSFSWSVFWRRREVYS